MFGFSKQHHLTHLGIKGRKNTIKFRTGRNSDQSENNYSYKLSDDDNKQELLIQGSRPKSRYVIDSNYSTVRHSHSNRFKTIDKSKIYRYSHMCKYFRLSFYKDSEQQKTHTAPKSSVVHEQGTAEVISSIK